MINPEQGLRLSIAEAGTCYARGNEVGDVALGDRSHMPPLNHVIHHDR
jgi:hypothetical protein